MFLGAKSISEKVHYGKLAAAWLEKSKEKIEVFFLPPYAPEYNPDEYLNHALKISVHSGRLPYTTDDISHKIQSFMRKLLQHHGAVTPGAIAGRAEGSTVDSCTYQVEIDGAAAKNPVGGSRLHV